MSSTFQIVACCYFRLLRLYISNNKLEIYNLNFAFSELCGTPGYLAPELLRASMYENAEGYGKEIDM